MSKKQDLQFEEFARDAIGAQDLDYVEVPISNRVFLLLGIVALAVVLVATGRVFYLNVARGDFYAQRALSNVNLEKPIPAHRGIITDKNGVVLAKNTETFSVFVNFSELLKDRRKFNQVLDALSETLNIPRADMEASLTQIDFENKTGVPLARNISSEDAIAVRGLNLPSVSVENDFRREYPMGPVMSSVLGYTGISATDGEIVGKTGLEHYYEDNLRGTDGTYLYTRDVKGNVLDERVSIEPISGNKLETAIDSELQEYAYKRMRQKMIELGVKGGVFIALNPKNGEVLSLISLPSYDNNIFMTPGKSNERVELVNDKNRPLFNRAINGSYNPGSTIKPLVALSALHENVIDKNFQVYSPGYIDYPNPYDPEHPRRFLDWRPQGWVNVISAIARSSNVFFYEVGGGFPAIGGQAGVQGLGIERLGHYWEKFGLGQKSGIDADSENVGFLPNPDEKQVRTGQPWRIGDTYNVSIGQGDISVSPMQLIDYISSIANNGVMYKPHLARAIDGVAITPEVMIDYSDWKNELALVQAGMRDGVIKDYGSSHILNDLPMNVAAKTGTAQINNNTKTNAFFAGYAPFEDPQIAIVVLIENAKEGSLNALPIAKDVMNWYYENRIKHE